MLKLLLNSSKTRVAFACRHISTSTLRHQQSEVVKTEDRGHNIRVIEKKPAKLPLVKNFFLAEVDTELLAFPEAIYETEHINSVNQQKKLYEDFLEANVFENPDNTNNVAKLKEFGSFRTNTTLITEALYGAGESEAKFLSYSAFLSQHHQVLKLIDQYGSASLKLKYVTKLESGEFIGSPALFETKSPSEKKLFNTAAKFNDSTNSWVLNGEKSFVMISPAQKGSTLFLVIASTESVDHIGDFKEGLTAFLVDGNLPGVNITAVDQPIGCIEKSFNQVTLSFKDVALDESK